MPGCGPESIHIKFSFVQGEMRKIKWGGHYEGPIFYSWKTLSFILRLAQSYSAGIKMSFIKQ